MSDERRIAVRSDSDIVVARHEARTLAGELSFSSTELVLIATAVSELARNIINYAREGEVVLSLARRDDRHGITVVARDDGPGIEDLDAALRDGYSTSNGLGVGLPGAKRLMDDFEIDTAVGRGTTIRATKWAR